MQYCSEKDNEKARPLPYGDKGRGGGIKKKEVVSHLHSSEGSKGITFFQPFEGESPSRAKTTRLAVCRKTSTPKRNPIEGDFTMMRCAQKKEKWGWVKGFSPVKEVLPREGR